MVKVGNSWEYLCESCAGGGQGNALTNIIFPTVINEALKSTERDHCVEVRAQQDDINIFCGPTEIFGPGKALETILVELGKADLELNKKKFQVFGTTGDACADKPEWLDETFVITDPAVKARVETAEAEAAAAPRLACSRAASSASDRGAFFAEDVCFPFLEP